MTAVPVALALVLVLVGAPSDANKRAAPTDLDELRGGFLRGDLVAVERGRALLEDSGAGVATGPIALLEDLSRLVRCLPLGPVPEREQPPYRGARMLVRLERIRLEALMRDGIYDETALVDLLGEPPLFRAKALDRTDVLVRWPVEQERWPGEVIEPRIEPARCASKAGASKESDPKVHAAARRTRARAVRETLAALVGELDRLPADTRGKVATAYLDLASAAPSFELPAEWDRALIAALEKSDPPWKSAGLVLLAGLREKTGDERGAVALYREILERAAPTAAEDSRVRARLVGLEEPNWGSVLEIARAVRAARSSDAPVLAHAEARALYALGRWTELETFGRAWLRRAHQDDEIDLRTRDLLVRLALQLEPAEAMAWIEEISPGDPKGRIERLDGLGKLAIETNNLDLATRVYDRLRTETAADAKKRGPAASSELAHWIAERALIEFSLEDPEAFAELIDEILAFAKQEGDRPLSRFAPHREVARLCQDLIGRLANEVREKPERRKFAALLLEAAVQLADKPSRWQAMLERYAESLRGLAGPYAAGRDGRAPSSARRASKDGEAARKRREKQRRVRELGEVIVPRLPPRLIPEDVRSEVPTVASFLTWEDAAGVWRSGAPWADLAAQRRAERDHGPRK
jgi:hypothetical protein